MYDIDYILAAKREVNWCDVGNTFNRKLRDFLFLFVI